MANGDITHEDLEIFLQISPFPAVSNSALTEDDIDEVAGEINAEVNLVLKRLGFALPITEDNSLKWLALTKKIGLAAWYLDNSMAQDVEEGNTRAQRYYDRYMARISSLVSSGGDLLDAPLATDDEGATINKAPIAGSGGLASVQAVRTHLAFTQYMYNMKGENDQFVNDYADSDVKRRTQGK